MPGQVEHGKNWEYCRNQVANAVEEGKQPGVHFVAAGTSANNGWGTPDRIKALEFSLAGFLVAKSRVSAPANASGWDLGRDFFGFDHQEAKNNPEHCPHTRWGDCSTNYSELATSFARDYGEPTDDAEEVSPGRFVRHYTKVNITFDCGKQGPSGATYDWLKETADRSGSTTTTTTTDNHHSVALKTADDVHARTMTYWATATNICGDPRSDRHGRADTTCVACCAKNRTDPDRAYCCEARNSTPGSRDWEDRMALLSAHRENLTGLIPCSHAIGPGGKLISDYSDNYANFKP